MDTNERAFFTNCFFVVALGITLLVTLALCCELASADEDLIEGRVVGRYDENGDHHDIEIVGDHAFIADYNKGLLVVDISDPTSPEKLGQLSTDGRSTALTLQNDHAYIADQANGLLVVDISDRQNPQEIGKFKPHGWMMDVDVAGNYAYAIVKDTALYIVDISDKDNPREVGKYESPEPTKVTIHGDIVFVSDDEKGLQLINVSNKNSPTLISIYDDLDMNYPYRVYGEGDHAFVTDRRCLQILNVSDPADPNRVGFFELGTTPTDLARGKSYLYLLDSHAGGYILDVSNHSDIQRIGYLPKRGRNLALKENHVFIVNQDTGLYVFEKAPVARILEVAPGVVPEDGSANFTGLGTDDSAVVDLQWRSSIDGIFGIHETVSCSNLSNGTHDIYLRVRDDHGAWSEWATQYRALMVNGRPRARINKIYPNPGLNEDSITLSGHGSFDDRKVEGYYWVSDIDGFLANTTTSYVVLINLSLGTHQISLTVYDENGEWSIPLNTTLIIHERPIAVIDSVSAQLALETEAVELRGHGTDDGLVEGFQWNSNIDGVLSRSPTLSVSNLSNGSHVLSFRVVDNYGVWSHWHHWNIPLRVNGRARANISSISPGLGLDENVFVFNGSGSFDDGSIRYYVWRSSIDGIFLNATRLTVEYQGLSAGVHTIYLKVMDNDSAWSLEQTGILFVHRRPLAKINSVSPNPAIDTSTIRFIGNGTDDGTIEAYNWRIVNGTGDEIHNATTPPMTLPIGTYTIYLKVLDNNDVWSDEVSCELLVETDIDSDGVVDSVDAFLNDPAASNDTDGDGHPDEWNQGKTATDSTTGLTLDAYPEDPAKWKKDDDSGGFLSGFEILALLFVLLISCSTRTKRKT